MQETVNDKYDFNETENNIKLVWENKINNCNCLFQNCGNIIKIDFSNFDFSLGITGNCMFLGCTSLTEIIFSFFWKYNIKRCRSYVLRM